MALELRVAREQSNLVIDLHTADGRDSIGPARLRYLVYENDLSTRVKRGENSGETLEHQQVVRYMSNAKSLQPDNRHRIAIDPEWNPERVGIAVLVTSPGSERYLQALHTPVASILSRQ